jgi:hypothetical protein
MLINQKPADDATGKRASLTRSRYDLINPVYTLCLDNGGFSGSGYNKRNASPCNSKVHSASACRLDFHLSQLSGLPFQRLLVLFTVFQLLSWENYTHSNAFVKDNAVVQTKLDIINVSAISVAQKAQFIVFMMFIWRRFL